MGSAKRWNNCQWVVRYNLLLVRVWLSLIHIFMSRNRRIVRMFSFDNRSYSLFEKKFVAGYQFMKVDVYKRQIQYFAEQNQDLRLTSDAMKLVLEDFMAQMKDLKDQEMCIRDRYRSVWRAY